MIAALRLRSGQAIAARAALMVFVVAAAARLGAWWLFPLPEPNYNYWLARGLLDLDAFALGPDPTSFIEPLYPAFLAAGMTVFGGDRAVLFGQALIAATGAPAMYLLGSRLTGNRAAGIYAALFYAVDPYFVRQATSFIELPVLLPLFLWTLERCTAVRSLRGALTAGTLVGLVLLTRTALLPATAGLLLILARRHGRLALAAAVAAAALVLPWALRSQSLNGSALPTRVGENLYVSTSQYAVGVVPRYDADLLIRFAQFRIEERLRSSGTGRDEAAADRILIEAALAFARTHPGQTVALKLSNLGWAFVPVLLPRNAKNPYTHAAMADGRMQITGMVRRPLAWDLGYAVFRAVVLFAAVLGLTRRRGLDDAWLLVVIGAELAVLVLFFPTTRLLAQLAAMQMLYAGHGLAMPRLSREKGEGLLPSPLTRGARQHHLPVIAERIGLTADRFRVEPRLVEDRLEVGPGMSRPLPGVGVQLDDEAGGVHQRAAAVKRRDLPPFDIHDDQIGLPSARRREIIERGDRHLNAAGLRQQRVGASGATHAVSPRGEEVDRSHGAADRRRDDLDSGLQPVQRHVPHQHGPRLGVRFEGDHAPGGADPMGELQRVDTDVGADIPRLHTVAELPAQVVGGAGVIGRRERLPSDRIDAERNAVDHPRHAASREQRPDRRFTEGVEPAAERPRHPISAFSPG
jgi:hypothetical protein